jgi:hypothetical protein
MRTRWYLAMLPVRRKAVRLWLSRDRNRVAGTCSFPNLSGARKPGDGSLARARSRSSSIVFLRGQPVYVRFSRASLAHPHELPFLA